MPALHGSDDDFLFEVQCPKSWLAESAPSGKSKTKTPADELLERFLRRHRMETPFTPRPIPQTQAQSQPAVGVPSFYPPLSRTFQTVWKEYVNQRPLESLNEAFEKSGKKYPHRVKARRTIRRAQKRRWAKVKAAR